MGEGWAREGVQAPSQPTESSAPVRLTGTFADARAASWGTVALVPTMGFLHEGHLSLIRTARDAADTVLVSIFVNPLQFDRADDLAAYPRDSHRDLELCRHAGVDVVFVPDAMEMYPTGPLTRVTVAGVADGMEGAHRPGHFAGVATVVTKLLAGLGPDRAHFGRKDAQQLAVVRTLVQDLSLPVEVVPGPTVREPDGLALSSRNVHLAGANRDRALGISRALFAAADAAEAGERSAEALVGVASRAMVHAGLEPDYVALADAHTMAPLAEVEGETVLATAAAVGGVRLIDNVVLTATGPSIVADRGTLLDEPSLLHR